MSTGFNLNSLITTIKRMTKGRANKTPVGLRPSNMFDDDNPCDMRIDITHADNGHIITLVQETNTGYDRTTRICMQGADIIEELKILISLGKLK